jgi:hypothetical protein
MSFRSMDMQTFFSFLTLLRLLSLTAAAFQMSW